MENAQNIPTINHSIFNAKCERFDLETSQTDQQINLISQYLSLDQFVSKQKGQTIQKNNQTPSNSSPQKKRNQPMGQTLPATPQTGKKPSIFHNFQKHLITTIKALIKLKRLPHHQKSSVSIAHEIWEYLCTSHKMSKRFLYCLLGKNILDKKSSQVENKFCKEYEEILEYFSEYSTQQIQAAQEYLCKEIIRQSHRILQCDQFKKGRMNNPSQFRSYYKEFISQLESGHISKRLPKAIKIALIKCENSKGTIS